MAQNSPSTEGTPQTADAPIMTNPTSADTGAPPAYYPPLRSETAAGAASIQPPSYDAASKLPSYEEAERSKAEEASSPPDPSSSSSSRRGATRRLRVETLGELLWGAPRGERGQCPGGTNGLSQAELQRQVLGTDMEFICCFLIAMVFNGLGLICALCCLTATIAGRSGAIAGFGLSIVKWGLLILYQKRYDSTWLLDTYQTYTPGVTPSAEDTKTTADTITFTCWLIVALGVLFFFQGVIHYFKSKRYATDINWLKQRYYGIAA